MHRPSHRRKPLLPGHRKPERTALSNADKWKIGTMLVAAIVIVFGVGISSAKRKHAHSIESTLARWRATYHLDDSQVRQIRGLEEQFHGSGNPLNPPTRTLAETHEHHLGISRAMAPEEAAHFLRDQEGEQRGTAVPPR